MFDYQADPDARGTSENPLPWVPDLVGVKSAKNKRAVMIIGSAYAGFVAGYSWRNFPLPCYRAVAENHWLEFQHLYLNHVVDGDGSYYNKLDALFLGHEARIKEAIITDWCRASFVKRVEWNHGVRRDQCGDPICRDQGVGVFFQYVDRNLEWHLGRLRAFQGKIILLGLFARQCLEFACHKANWPVSYNAANGGAAIRPLTIAGNGGFWANPNVAPQQPTIIGQIDRGKKGSLMFSVIPHPSRDLTTNVWGPRLNAWLGAQV